MREGGKRDPANTAELQLLLVCVANMLRVAPFPGWRILASRRYLRRSAVRSSLFFFPVGCTGCYLDSMFLCFLELCLCSRHGSLSSSPLYSSSFPLSLSVFFFFGHVKHRSLCWATLETASWAASSWSLPHGILLLKENNKKREIKTVRCYFSELQKYVR